MDKYSFPDGSTPTVCIVGAGFSGLTAAIKLKQELKLTSFEVFDENENVGGTWLVNKYPGVACDVPSHLYSWSFELNPDWSHSFSSGQEIWDYIHRCANKYDLYRHISFNSKVTQMEWVETLNQWRITVLNTQTNTVSQKLFDLIINGPGALRVPAIPKEFKAFTGPKIHTAQWDESVDLENKIVGIVGSGASAVQVIQTIAPKVKQLHSYQRKPAWVTRRTQHEFSNTTKWIFRYVPFAMKLYRLFIFMCNELFLSAFTYGSILNKFTSWSLKRSILSQLPPGDPKAVQLTPNYTVGCKRIIFSSDYYPALGLPHVKVIRDKITNIVGSEIHTETSKQKLDVLILATGFEVQKFYEPMKVFGKDGLDVMAKWMKDGPATYYGITASIAPNHFILLGPNTALGHNSVLMMIECQVNYVVQILKEMMTRNRHRVTLKSEAETEFVERMVTSAESTVWVKGKCDSWYLNSNGVVTTLWTQSCTRYWLETRSVDHSKFDYE